MADSTRQTAVSLPDEALRRKALGVIAEVKKVIFGKDEVISKLLLALLAKGHVLLEDVPGVGKTSLAVALSASMSLDYNRIQFTPEVMPADVVGYSQYDKESDTLRYRPGVTMCDLLLVDEINRASSKTQSALLEAMEENAVTVDGTTHAINPPFIVIATQNPAGSAGTQLLPESQLDRFMLRLSLGYLSAQDEASMLKSRHAQSNPLTDVCPVADARDLVIMQEQVEAVYIDDDLCRYISDLVEATRHHPELRLGASPRGSLALLRMSQAAAWLSGRDYVLPTDIAVMFEDALAHRVLLTQASSFGDGRTHTILADILKATPRPPLTREA
jgi:MoxR-like ATPase